jgi:hypothetical protein
MRKVDDRDLVQVNGGWRRGCGCFGFPGFGRVIVVGPPMFRPIFPPIFPPIGFPPIATPFFGGLGGGWGGLGGYRGYGGGYPGGLGWGAGPMGAAPYGAFGPRYF